MQRSNHRGLYSMSQEGVGEGQRRVEASHVLSHRPVAPACPVPHMLGSILIAATNGKEYERPNEDKHQRCYRHGVMADLNVRQPAESQPVRIQANGIHPRSRDPVCRCLAVRQAHQPETWVTAVSCMLFLSRLDGYGCVACRPGLHIVCDINSVLVLEPLSLTAPSN